MIIDRLFSINKQIHTHFIPNDDDYLELFNHLINYLVGFGQCSFIYGFRLDWKMVGGWFENAVFANFNKIHANNYFNRDRPLLIGYWAPVHKHIEKPF